MRRIFLCLFSIGALTSTPAFADDITILAPNLPPMFEGGQDGREAEVIMAAMEKCGHTVTFNIQPFTRHWASFKNGDGDAVTTVPAGLPMGGTETVTYIQYQNGLSSLSSSATNPSNFDELAGKNVVAFEGAGGILPGLKDAASKFGSYREVADQNVQSRLLFSGRTDVVIGDGMIFAALNEALVTDTKLNFDVKQPVVFKKSFAPSDYTMNFRNPTHASDFDRCFKEASDDGTIGKINKSWTDKYRNTLGNEYLGF